MHLGNFWNLISVGGGLNSEVSYIKFWVREEGLIRERGLIEKGDK